MRNVGLGRKLLVWLILLAGIAFVTFWMFVPFIADEENSSELTAKDRRPNIKLN